MAAVATMSLNSCGSDDNFTDTIFPEVSDDVDSTLYSYKFDKWLKINYLDEYNLDFRYKMQDVGTNMNYNLVPASYQNSVDLAVLAKYLWFDVYKEVAGSDFLKMYGPRIIHLIGSPAYNPTTGTMILGLAEGGIKVSLFRVNELNFNSFDQLNEYYFKTMHHEFGHILHQTKSYPTKFNNISLGHYDANNWQDRQDGVCFSLGFASTYGSSAYREDFAEIIANYIVKTDAQWERINKLAARGWESGNSEDPDASYYCWYYYKDNETGDENKVLFGIDDYSDNLVVNYTTPDGDEILVYKNSYSSKYYQGTTPYKQDATTGKWTDAQGRSVDQSGNLLDESGAKIKVPIQVFAVEDKDGIDGVAALQEKIQIVREWLKDSFGVDIDKIRAEVQKRQVNYDINELRKQVTDMK